MKLIIAAALAASFSAASVAAELIPIDDSYTVSQRYYAYKKEHPELEWPKLQFAAGQQVLFDRLYKKVGDRELHIDVFLPVPGHTKRQAILFVHGGGWRSGNKSNFYAMANLLAQRGYVVLIPEFRLSPEAAYPAGLLDINDAIVWAKSQAGEFGFDADKLAIGGESSGGQMAALIAYSATRNLFKTDAQQDTRTNALIDLDGVLDFTTPLAQQYENAAGVRSPAALWLGGAFETAGDTWREASAARYVDATSPPTLIVSGEAPRFTAGREAVMAELDRRRIRNAHLHFEGAPHAFWLFEPYLGKITAAIDEFLGSRDTAVPAGKVAGTSVYRVAHDCAGARRCHTSIQAALDAATATRGRKRIVVKVAAGDFYEKVAIRRANTVLRGEGIGRTRLHFDAVAETAGRFHRNNWGTPGSATLTIDADRVTVEGLTVENTFDYRANDALPDGDPRKIGNSQGVAVLLDIHSDRVLIRDAALLGYQDTLFANGARAYIRRSLIAGNVDFIFGNGQVLIEDSEVRSRRRGATLPATEIQSFLLAPSTQVSQRVGIVVHRSRLTREDGVPDNAVALGRPWHPTTQFADGRYADPNAVGQAAFIDCFMDAHIHADHWTSMNGTARDGTKTAVFRPQEARFFEAGSYGPGARHGDIGVTAVDPFAIQDVYKAMFKDWREAMPR